MGQTSNLTFPVSVSSSVKWNGLDVFSLSLQISPPPFLPWFLLQETICKDVIGRLWHPIFPVRVGRHGAPAIAGRKKNEGRVFIS